MKRMDREPRKGRGTRTGSQARAGRQGRRPGRGREAPGREAPRPEAPPGEAWGAEGRALVRGGGEAPGTSGGAGAEQSRSPWEPRRAPGQGSGKGRGQCIRTLL